MVAELECPICLEVLKDPFVTTCGHTFCYTCVTSHLQNRNSCPSCSEYLIPDKIYPNHLLKQVASNYAREKQLEKISLVEQLRDAIQTEKGDLKLGDVEVLLSALQEKRHELQQKEKARRLELLLHFLQNSRSNKSGRLNDLQDELSVLSKDIDQVLRRKSLPQVQNLSHQLPSHSGSKALVPKITSSNPSLTHSIKRDILQEGLGTNEASRTEERGNRGEIQRRDSNDQGIESHRNNVLLERHGDSAERPLPSDFHGAHAIPPRHREPNNVVNNQEHIRVARTEGEEPHNGMLHPHNALLSAFQSAGFPELAEERVATASAFLRVPSVTRDLPNIDIRPDEDTVQWFIRSRFNLLHPNPAQDPSNTASQARDQGHDAGRPSNNEDEGNLINRLPSIHQEINQQPNGHAHARQNLHTNVTESHVTQNDFVASNLTNGSDLRSSNEIGSSTTPKRKFESQFEDLQKQYFNMRQEQLASVKKRRLEGLSHKVDRSPFENGVTLQEDLVGEDIREIEREEEGSSWQGANGIEDGGESVSPMNVLDKNEMREFSRTLSLYMKNTKLEVLASISASTPRNSAAILSGVAFNLDCKLFASAGVSKRVALYDTKSVLQKAGKSKDKEVPNRPLAELMTPSKLSCISWNQFHESHLLSSDYEGVITLWDTQSQQSVAEFEAHQKRIWSVDFCPANNHSLVSASDDGLVKLWSTRQQLCTGEINMRANVCCAQFNPYNEHEISAGCADHRVHVFDIRHPQRPLQSFAGHGKSVSYVRYMSVDRVVSASTDSTLRAWSKRDKSAVRTYTGHVNTKNFVGLAADGDFIASGSETSEVYVYYKSMSRPVSKALFSHPPAPPSQAGVRWRSGPAFISALCWQPKSEDRILLAGSSHGTLQLLKLVTRE